ncbi:adenylate/guanylate cyclase domain-containing protein [Shimia sp.]|uniref:adenylate/guanylate cyclase domain-containing protein n=1 Tax=Shimia sp. TaxID=1954381 RepID=UPI003BAB6B62
MEGLVSSCSQCDTENPVGANFCQHCGNSLRLACSNCGHQTTPGAKFCTNCGTALEEEAREDLLSATPAPQDAIFKVPTIPPPEDVAERRLLTVLFSDLVGSTALSAQLDPEDYRDLITRYRTLVETVVDKFGGKVANFAGDGVVAVFGYPVAKEGSHYAAAVCALEINDRAAEIASALNDSSVSTQVRLGLHTGPVVVGAANSASLDEKMWLFGDTPNVAARVQSAAKVGQVVVTEVTRRLIGDRLEYASLGSPELAGVEAPLELFSVSISHGVFQTPRREVLQSDTPIIGRGAEIALVKSRWDDALEGDGQVLLLTGDAGVGKTKIAFALNQDISNGTFSSLTFFGSPMHQSSAFFPVKNALASVMNLTPGAEASDNRAQAIAFMQKLGLDVTISGAPVLRLMGFDEETGSSAPMAPEREKAALVSALLQICCAMEAEHPLLLLLDDVHWMDASTLDFVDQWIARLAERRCLILMTARGEFDSPWRNQPHVTTLELNRLGRADTFKLVESIAGMRPPAAILNQLAERTDGVPLFVEELTKMAMETGLFEDHSQSTAELSLAIPESLQDSLMSRLDRLSASREVVQVAAAIGRVFGHDILREVLDWDELETRDALDQLLEAELIVPAGLPGDVQSYKFRHALVQDAAYQSMLRATAAKWHGRIARVLDTGDPREPGGEPEILGYHYQKAGNFAKAEGFMLSAARRATLQSANVEAISHLQNSLECLRELPPSQERDHREIDLQILLAVPLAFVRGYAHETVITAYARAQELCRQYGEMERLFKVIYGQFRSMMLGGEYATSQNNADRLVSLARDLGSPMTLAATERSMGALQTYLGHPHKAISFLDAGIAVDLTLEDRKRGLDFDVVDLSVALNGYLGLSRWLAGDVIGAREASERCLVHAEETAHPFSVSFANAFAGWLGQFSGDEARVAETSARLITLSEEYSFQFWRGWARVMNGWAQRHDPQVNALAEIRLGLDEWRETGCRLGLSYFLYLYADVALLREEFDLAEDLLAEANDFVTISGEKFWVVGLAGLQGRVALAKGNRTAAITHLERAIALAFEMGHHGALPSAVADLAAIPSAADRLRDASDNMKTKLGKAKAKDPALTQAWKALAKLAT